MVVELDTKREEEPKNGHTWQTFDDDQAFLQHILSKKPAEQLVDVPEWDAQILCRALNAESRIEIHMTANDEKRKVTDFRRAFHLVVMHGCYNPTTGRPVFDCSHADEHVRKQKINTLRVALMQQQDGGVVERLALTILRLSRMLSDDVERAKKN